MLLFLEDNAALVSIEMIHFLVVLAKLFPEAFKKGFIANVVAESLTRSLSCLDVAVGKLTC